MKRLGLLFAFAGFLAGGLIAAELAPGLAYLRPGMTPAPTPGSAVLDLRYVTDEAEAGPLFAAVEPGKANLRRVVLVLVSPETATGLRNRLIGIPRCLTIGRAAPELKTDIVVTTSAETDRRAFDALAAGTPPEKLLIENATKARFDEASLIREHTGTAEPGEDAESAAEPAAPPPPAPPALVDPVLQRAVQIHRGLAVLKKP
jgi:hypothetical protein